jgi:aspartyl-tRNA synthetase
LELQVSDIFSDSPFKVFADTLKSGGIIKVLCVPSGAKNYSNTALKKGDIYNEAIKSGAKGLPFLKVIDDGKLIFFSSYLHPARGGGGGGGFYVYLKMKRYFGFHP